MGSPSWAGTAGCGSSSRARPASLHRGSILAVPGAAPIAHCVGQARPAAPDGDPTSEALWHGLLLLPGRRPQQKEKAWGTRGDFPTEGGEKKIKKKKKKKKEGGCPWQLTAAWHLCPRAGVQAPEQARCHGSRWARRQQPRASILPHQGGDGCLGQISQLRMSKQLPVWSLYTYN